MTTKEVIHFWTLCGFCRRVLSVNLHSFDIVNIIYISISYSIIKIQQKDFFSSLNLNTKGTQKTAATPKFLILGLCVISPKISAKCAISRKKGGIQDVVFMADSIANC